MTNEDISIADEAPQAADTVNESPKPSVTLDELQTADFDLGEWLSGLQPTRRAYPVGGKRIVMQARTVAWLRERNEELADETVEDRTAQLLAEHTVIPSGMTREAMLRIGEAFPVEYDQLNQMAVELDTKPGHTISPRFLRVASD